METRVKDWVDVLRDYLWPMVVCYNRKKAFIHFLEGIIAAIEGMKVRSFLMSFKEIFTYLKKSKLN